MKERNQKFFRTSAGKRVAQHAGAVGPRGTPPPPPLSDLEERALLSQPPRGAPANLCKSLNGKFYSRPLLEWQLTVADVGGGGGAGSSAKLMDF